MKKGTIVLIVLAALAAALLGCWLAGRGGGPGRVAAGNPIEQAERVILDAGGEAVAIALTPPTGQAYRCYQFGQGSSATTVLLFYSLGEQKVLSIHLTCPARGLNDEARTALDVAELIK